MKTEPAAYREWWKALNDPVLDSLIQVAYEQNLPLRIAGARVFEARARLGIAIGEQLPANPAGLRLRQLQQGERARTLGYDRSPGVDFDYTQAGVGATAVWELDFWGKFRRAVESENASFLSSIAAYDSAGKPHRRRGQNLRAYPHHRGSVANSQGKPGNPEGESEDRPGPLPGRRYKRARREQALTLLFNTEATIPSSKHFSGRRRTPSASSSACRPVTSKKCWPGAQVFRRRPRRSPRDSRTSPPPPARHSDCRAPGCGATRLIGVAKADLYRAFSLTGTFGFLSSDVGRFQLGDITSWKSRTGSLTCSSGTCWNYGRITNLVRVQDARFQELIFNGIR